MKKLSRFYRFLVYVLPGILFFSYHPIIRLGSNETMNFELSLPLIWLVVFDIVAAILLLMQKWQEKKTKSEELNEGMLTKRVNEATSIKDSRKKNNILKFEKIIWFLFPTYLTISILWSANTTRGVLTSAVLWLIYIAIFSFWQFREIIGDEKFKRVFWRSFILSSLVVAGWCFVQCVLDVLGVPRECTLLCAGCVSQTFGFPHPNGFAIEPQFMGNLLLAPVLIMMYWFIDTSKDAWNLRARIINFWRLKEKADERRIVLTRWLVGVLDFILAATLFLTFSRGAIYAFLTGLIFLTVFKVFKKEWKRVLMMWGIVVIAFLFTLNLQGVFSHFSVTDDTYFSGIAKVINHLSLGVVDVRGKVEEQNVDKPLGDSNAGGNITDLETKQKSSFDGYVEESTNVRVKLTSSAIKVWKTDFRTMLIGVGIGGAGEAMYLSGETDTPKEIVQNEYASLLLETGAVGASFAVLVVGAMLKVMKRSQAKVLLISLMIAYSVSLCFFSGLANALQIYLLMGLFLFGSVLKLSRL